MNILSRNILSARPGQTTLFSVGQAGYLIKSSAGQLLGIDLYLSDCVERLEGHIGFKRLLPKILSPYDLELDCLVATHPHFDHFDFDSVPEIMANGRTRLFASTGCEVLVRELRMKNDGITYIKPGDTCECGDFLLHFVGCDHGAGAPDAVGVGRRADAHPVAEALHDRKAQTRALLVGGGCKQRLHSPGDVGDPAAFIAYPDRDFAAAGYLSAYVDRSALPAVAVYNAVSHRLGHSGFKVAQLAYGGVEVHNKRGNGATGKGFVAAF